MVSGRATDQDRRGSDVGAGEVPSCSIVVGALLRGRVASEWTSKAYWDELRSAQRRSQPRSAAA